jgi:hypothetical protein
MKVQLTSSKRPSILIAMQEYPDPSQNWVDQQYLMLVFLTVMLVPRTYGTGKGVVCAWSAQNNHPTRPKKNDVDTHRRYPSRGILYLSLFPHDCRELLSISCKSCYIHESTDNCGSDRTEIGRLRTLSVLSRLRYAKQAKAVAET